MNYLIMPENVPECYFYKPDRGICMKKQSSGVWQEAVTVFAEGTDSFAVYCSGDKTVHLICTDRANNLVYAVSSDGEWKKYVISKLSSDIAVSDMRLFSVKGRLNMMYAALYGGEALLVHCILGDHAKPSAVDALEAPHFCISGNRVYYTNKNGVLGFAELADEKPSVFNPLYEDAHFGTVCSIGGERKILFSRGFAVFLDGIKVARDVQLEQPVLVNARDKLYIMWKSGDFIKYVTSSDGKSFGSPMRFMSTDKATEAFIAQNGDEFSLYYGYITKKDIVLLGNPGIFEISAQYSANSRSELERIRAMLDRTQRDISDTKKELARLGRLLGSLTDGK